MVGHIGGGREGREEACKKYSSVNELESGLRSGYPYLLA